MDETLLHVLNQTFTHPTLDWLMLLASTLGLVLLPLLATWCWQGGQRRLGQALWIALAAALFGTFVFYYLALRPRPTEVRLLLATPPFPSFPSGHAALSFAAATLSAIYLRRWRWKVAGLLGAGLISYSRLYLGHHYPSDVIGGMVLGSGIGAAVYGLCLEEGDRTKRYRWLLWLQLAIVFVVSQMAYLGFLPVQWLRWPLADKVMHFLLFGTLAFWLNLWLMGKTFPTQVWRIGIVHAPIALLLPLTFVTLEEGMQAWSPYRTLDLRDWLANTLGLCCFWWLSRQWLARDDRNRVFDKNSVSIKRKTP